MDLMTRRRALLARVESGGGRLPAEYQEVEYIESDGNQYINSGIIPSANDVYSFQGAFRDISDAVLFGCRSSGDHSYGNQMYLNRNVGYVDAVFLATNTASTNRSDFSKNIFFYRGSNLPLEISERDVAISEHINNAVWNPTQPIYLLGFNNLGTNFSSASGGKLSHFKTDGRCEFISCRRKADSKPGMYDLVSGTFLTNAGTGEFTVGADVN